MSGPGSGRYTKYVPVASERNQLLAKLFNDRAGDKGNIYGKTYQTDPVEAAATVVARATAKVEAGVGGLIPKEGKQQGDLDMFPSGVSFQYNDEKVPDLEKIKWAKAGDPANAYVPDVTSPGPGKTDGTQKDKDPELTVADLKGAGYKPGAPGTGTTSPSVTSPKLGDPASVGLGGTLEKGKSAV